MVLKSEKINLLIKKVYGDKCTSHAQDFNWFGRFHDGQEGLYNCVHIQNTIFFLRLLVNEYKDINHKIIIIYNKPKVCALGLCHTL